MIPTAIAARRRRWKLYTTLLVIALFITIILSTCIGSFFIPPTDVLKALLKPLNPLVDVDVVYEKIILTIRVPRVLMGCVVGAALSLAGALLQGMFRNPMADPYVVGVSAGAALGAALAIVLGFGFAVLGIAAIPTMAFMFAMIALVAVYNLSRVGGRVPVMTLLLSGIAVGMLLSAITSFLSMMAGEKLHGLYFWLLGNLAMARWDYVTISMPILIVCCIVAMLYARDLNIMLMGEETALTLGVNIEVLKLILIVVSSLATAIAVSFIGMIAFVGLMVPHIVRLIVGPDHRVLLPCSMLFGAIFLVTCDSIARVALAPAQIPVGIVTALAGGPFFIYLLRKRKREYAL
ncbi:MAG: iron chelate uptake ABC transporter family permease subunit [Candidatus Nezhaarchaeota archaeon]|nr:iron chelate uptake ABC transporter family permease subunit [Candidatus Nezhaarchaeota archaeon]MCX8141282.1 iron chelate uptake ABC transporter family permease subunit [Candidatus Nezhaarchaeota archaeon]MDW8049548.1 iron chelate uptake ABC transporter family permease subunit [Nitrososphaerota archaeon]